MTDFQRLFGKRFAQSSAQGTSALIHRWTGVLLLAALMAIWSSLSGGHGENPDEALAIYARFMPGSAVPGDVSCRSLNEYPGAYGEICTLDAIPFCRQGFLVAREGVITYTRLIGCDFPAAYLIARYGRPKRIAYFRRVVMLVWDELSAQLRRTGWFQPMQRVPSVGWW